MCSTGCSQIVFINKGAERLISLRGQKKGQDKGPEEGLFGETTQNQNNPFKRNLEN